MSKGKLKEDQEKILRVIGKYSDGANLEILIKQFPQIPRRTIQRRLSNLVKNQKLIKIGRARALRYKIVVEDKNNKKVYPPKKSHLNEEEFYIEISSKSEPIKNYVRQPIQKRNPIGYNPNFLLSYKPNNTYYIDSKTKAHLNGLGKSQEIQRPAGTYARKILQRLLIDLSWNSSRLEGNTYSLLETEQLLETGESAIGKNLKETQMILNHKAAIELLVENAAEMGFNRYSILNLHALLSDNLLADPSACGRLRSVPVNITKSVYHPLEVPQKIEDFFNTFLQKANQIKDPFEQSFFAMVHLPYLQPFEDVNKRVSRLAANIPFIRENLSPLSFIDVPEKSYLDGLLGLYELNKIELYRDVFVWAYERSCARYAAVKQSLGEPDQFKLQNRNLIIETVTKIVKDKLNKKAANSYIQKQAKNHLSISDQKYFIEVVDIEIMSLHEGNIARYKLRPSQFQSWKNRWK